MFFGKTSTLPITSPSISTRSWLWFFVWLSIILGVTLLHNMIHIHIMLIIQVCMRSQYWIYMHAVKQHWKSGSGLEMRLYIDTCMLGIGYIYLSCSNSWESLCVSWRKPLWVLSPSKTPKLMIKCQLDCFLKCTVMNCVVSILSSLFMACRF